MIIERLKKLDKDRLIEIILSKNYEIKQYEEKFKEQKEVGEVFFKDKIYKVSFREVKIDDSE